MKSMQVVRTVFIHGSKKPNLHQMSSKSNEMRWDVQQMKMG